MKYLLTTFVLTVCLLLSVQAHATDGCTVYRITNQITSDLLPDQENKEYICTHPEVARCKLYELENCVDCYILVCFYSGTRTDVDYFCHDTYDYNPPDGVVMERISAGNNCVMQYRNSTHRDYGNYDAFVCLIIGTNCVNCVIPEEVSQDMTDWIDPNDRTVYSPMFKF